MAENIFHPVDFRGTVPEDNTEKYPFQITSLATDMAPFPITFKSSPPHPC